MKKLYAKINIDESIDQMLVDTTNYELIESLKSKGFVLYSSLSAPEGEPTGSYSSYVKKYKNTYNSSGEKVGVEPYWDILEHDPVKVTAEIERLTAELSASDYKVVKNFEMAYAGKSLDYDPLELHESRQPLRDRICALEGLL